MPAKQGRLVTFLTHIFSMDELTLFAQDLYDVLGMNTNHCTQKEFFDKYVRDDDAFMVSDEGRDKQVIYFDNYTITIKRNK